MPFLFLGMNNQSEFLEEFPFDIYIMIKYACERESTLYTVSSTNIPF